MKREGRQHGMVRTYCILPSPLNPRPSSRFINRSDSPPTAGLFARVDRHPTNHSKFTGKCGKPRCSGCHLHPFCKSKDKTKGNHKVKSFDVVSNCRLITWRVVDGRPGLSFSGFSASGMLDHLDNEFVGDDQYYDYDVDEIEGDCDEPEPEIREIEVDCEVEDEMGFCDLGFLFIMPISNLKRCFRNVLICNFELMIPDLKLIFEKTHAPCS